MADTDITVRRATEADLQRIVHVGAAALGWKAGEPNEALFRWKHVDNPFGPSPIWLAESGDRLAGYRAFMRWELVNGTGARRTAVRAVDTATHPDFQRRGIFRTLTMQGVEEMTAEGVDVVFNTPNEQSRPGYLKMGWVDVGRLPIAARVTGLGSVLRVARARVAADKWSEATDVGVDAGEWLASVADSDLTALVGSQPLPAGWSTALSADVVRWRYSLEPLRYRVWCPDGADAGVVVFRIRRRGGARECAVGHVLAPDGDAGRRRALLRGLAKAVDADYLLTIGGPDLRAGLVPAPGQGPRLTARSLASDPPAAVDGWSFQLGDIEIF